MPDRNSEQFKKGLKAYQQRGADGFRNDPSIQTNPGGVIGPGKKHKGWGSKKGSLKGLFKSKSNGKSFGKHR